MLSTIVQITLLVLLLPLAAVVGYLLMLTTAAFRASKKTTLQAGDPTTKFLFLIPAHNEELLLPTTLDSLNRLAYPAELFDIHVVADNCTDQTAAVARDRGARVHERFNETLRGKGYALQWLLERLWAQSTPHDAAVILDADTIVSANFLKVMDSRVRQGERIIQAYYAVRDPDRSWGISLRYAALAVLHFLRPQGRMIMGGSTGLKGNGMVFHHDILRQQEWTSSLTEDIEFHMAQVLEGERVYFAPDAVVWAEMPESLADADTQNERWERGRLQMARRFVPRLLNQAFGRRPVNSRFLLFDAAMEHLIPPFSILMGLSLLTATTTLIAFFMWPHPLAGINLGLAGGIVVGQAIYLLAGLSLADAPAEVYKALLYAPGFMIWKIWLYAKVILKRSDDSWVRTARNQ